MAQVSACGGQTVQDALVSAAKQLRAAQIDQPGLDARLLLAHVMGVGQAQLITSGNVALSEKHKSAFCNVLERRGIGEPVSRIIGTREFFGRDFTLSSAVLDPRADTEILIDTALNWAKHKQLAPGFPSQTAEVPSTELRILDLGVGSGAIILTLLAELPDATGVGVDVCAKALGVAARNADKLDLKRRVNFICSDWDADLEGVFDLIVSNPPYIAAGEIGELAKDVKNYDPLLALDGGVDGLVAYRALAGVAERRLKPGGCLIAEIGESQADAVGEIFGSARLVCEAVKVDLAGRDRVVVGHK